MKHLWLTLALTSPAIAEPVLFSSKKPRWRLVAAQVEEEGRGFLGAPYIYGAISFSRSKGFDCSLFVQHLYDSVGIPLPRGSWQQASVGVLVEEPHEIRKGDLIFFKKTPRVNDKRITHVAIYLGENKLLHTFKAPRGVAVTDFKGKVWGRLYSHARRVIPEDLWLELPPFSRVTSD